MSDCWIWERSLTPKGYGQLHYEGTTRRAHRVMYELLLGPIPEGAVVHHLCENKACINPEHLRLLSGNAEHRRVHRRPICRKGLHAMVGRNRTSRGLCRACRNEKFREQWAAGKRSNGRGKREVESLAP